MRLRSVFLGALVALLSAASWAQQCREEVHFAPGTSSTTLRGSVLKNAVCQYFFYAKKGQAVTVKMGKNDRPQAFLFSPVEFGFDDIEPTFVLPKSGRYELRVGMTRTDARKFSQPQPFTAHFSITSPQLAGVDPSQAAVQSSGFAGNYEGTLPCLTCTGVDTFLVLYDSGNYTLSQNFLQGQNGKSFSQQGHWQPMGELVVLEPNDTKIPNSYLFRQNKDLYVVSREQAGAPNPKLNPQYRLRFRGQ